MIDQTSFSQMFIDKASLVLFLLFMFYSMNLNWEESFEIVSYCFFGAWPGKEEFAVARQPSFVRPTSSFLSLICDHRLQNELSVPNVLDRHILVMHCRMYNSFFKYLFLASFKSVNGKCSFDPCSVCAQWYVSAGESRHIHLNLIKKEFCVYFCLLHIYQTFRLFAWELHK